MYMNTATYSKTDPVCARGAEGLLAPGPQQGDEEWQLSKDSADAATAAAARISWQERQAAAVRR